MKLEIGGGTKGLGGDWVNIDMIPTADIVHDLDVTPWPIADDSVDEAYSSHCIEHLQDPFAMLKELARVCRIGARIEIRCPSPGADSMWTFQHRHCWSVILAKNIDHYFAADYWTGPKRLRLLSWRHEPSEFLERFRRVLPQFRKVDDQDVMLFFPRTAHECRFFYECGAT